MKLKIGAIIAGFIVVMAVFTAMAVAAPKDVMGVIAREGDVTIEPQEGSYANGAVTIEKVIAPADSFVAVHLTDGEMPGKRIGVVAVKAGVSTDVRVPLTTDKLTPELIAAVHVDRGTPGEFEFDMKDPEHSPDRPYFVNGMEAAMKFKAGQ